MSTERGEEMFVYSAKESQRPRTPWGKEVKMRLLDRDMTQQDLVTALTKKGFKVDKMTISYLLRGIGSSARTGEIDEINRILEIPTA